MIRVGWLGTGPFSFYGHYMGVLNATGDDYNPLDMRVTHIWGDDYSKNYKGSAEWVKKMVDSWNTGRQSPAALVERYSIPNLCKDYHDMVDEVDAAMIMDFDRVYELAEPFIMRGLPVFLSSPVAVNVPEVEKLLDLAEKHGSAVLTGSFTAEMPGSVSTYARVKRDRIRSFFSSSWFHFFTSYANDGLEPVHWLIDGKVRKVRLVGWDGSSGYDPDGIPFSRIHLEYEPVGDNPPIEGMLSLGGFKREGMWFRVYYDNHEVFESRTQGGNRNLNFRDFLLDVQQVFATNKSTETREDIVGKLKVVIAAYKSANEGNRFVSIDEVGDYRMPTVRIENWDQIPK